MPILDAEIIVYAAENMPNDDSSTTGGAIDETVRVIFTDLAEPDDLEVVSDNAGDNGNITVDVRVLSGVVAQETVALNGTTPVPLTNLGTAERFMQAMLAGAATGNVTIRRGGGGATVAVIPAGEIGVRRLFSEAVSHPDNPKTYYEKVFVKNANPTLALQNATIAESADPTGKCAFGLESAVNGSGMSDNRLTAPAGVTLDGNPKAVPGTHLAAGDAIGVWVSLALDAGEQPIKSSYTLQASGSST